MQNDLVGVQNGIPSGIGKGPKVIRKVAAAEFYISFDTGAYV